MNVAITLLLDDASDAATLRLGCAPVVMGEQGRVVAADAPEWMEPPTGAA